MCMILDTNQWGDFLKPTKDMQPVRRWLADREGKLVFSDHKNMEEELKKHRKMQKYLFNLLKIRQAKTVSGKKVEQEMEKIRNGKHRYRSNDLPLLGLARAGKVKLLCSRDKKLQGDFKNIVKGNVYKNDTHKHLLTKDTCP